MGREGEVAPPPREHAWLRSWILAIPVILWPLGEFLFGPDGKSLFLPFFNQIDTAYPIAWMARGAAGEGISDLAVWEYRNSADSPAPLFNTWPALMGSFMRIFGLPGSYWLLVFLIHGVWIFVTQKMIRRWFPEGGVSWLLAALFVYGSFLAGVNVYFHGPLVWRWSWSAVYENFRAYPSDIALLGCTLAVWRLHVAYTNPTLRRFLVAALCVVVTLYGRPFDWMVLVTFVGLMGLWSFFCQGRGHWHHWAWCLGIIIALSLHLLISYLLLMKTGAAGNEDRMARGVLEGKEPIHFLKYALMAGAICFAGWCWLGWITWKADRASAWNRGDAFFLGVLLLASFLPYFQHLPSGRTINSYQYYLIYFAMPLLWLMFLVGVAVWAGKRIARVPARLWIVFGFSAGVTAQACFLTTSSTMMGRLVFDRRQQLAYDALARQKDAVALSPGMISGTSQDLILRSHAWSFVPHPMMFGTPSMAPTTELLERQLLAKLILTGKVSDLAPLFSEKGLADYARFRRESDTETNFWLDRLEHTPRRAFYLFDPVKSRKDLEVRRLQVPVERLQQKEAFAYFTPPFQDVFRKVVAMEGWSLARQVDAARARFRLTHVLLTPECARFESRLRSCSERLQPVLRTGDGTTLWEFRDPH